MSEGYNETIDKIFNIALKSFGATNNIDVALENSNYEPNVAAPYLAGYMLPAPTESADLYFTDRRSGIYQIDVAYPSNEGTAAINRMIDLLNIAFKPSTTLTRNDICVEVTNFSAERVTINDGWAIKPISLTWVTYTERL